MYFNTPIHMQASLLGFPYGPSTNYGQGPLAYMTSPQIQWEHHFHLKG